MSTRDPGGDDLNTLAAYQTDKPQYRFFAERQPEAASYWFAPADERAPGGESFSELCARVNGA